MRPYLVVIYWRHFSWTLRAHADMPAALRGLYAHFGTEHPISLQVIAK